MTIPRLVLGLYVEFSSNGGRKVNVNYPIINTETDQWGFGVNFYVGYVALMYSTMANETIASVLYTLEV